MATVYILSSEGVQEVLFTAPEEECQKFCEDNNYSWTDEHDYVWSLFIDA